MSDIAHQPCPYPSCGSSDAFSYNTDGFGKCHACNRSYPSREKTYDWANDKYPTKGKDMAVFDTFTPKRIEAPDSGKYTPLRGITQATMEEFGVLTYADRQEYVYPIGS